MASKEGEDVSVQVAVRLRPFVHAYEIDTETREPLKHISKVVSIEAPTTCITDPSSGQEHRFTFDFSYDSSDPDAKDYASQEVVWRDMGISVLDTAWEGYNVTLFAYGQTGAGKSYSMTGGSGEEEGIMPRASREIFKRIDSNKDPEVTFRVEVSMCEVYMEKIHDLFNPKAGGKAGLKVREHPKMGVYVQDLSAKLVQSYEDIENWMEVGIKNRTKAATEMNNDSSRAHTILEVTLTQQRKKEGEKKAQLKRSKINLVDLAGSERLGRTGAKGTTMKQGIAINQSLTNLGQVIQTLADNSNLPKRKQKRVPYRNSKLTLLLRNSLGGNSKTIMIAALAPSNVNFADTLGTLRYANRTKKIKNKAVVNEDESTKLINGLKAEIEALRSELQEKMQSGGSKVEWEREREELMARLRESESLAQQAAMTWEEKSKLTNASAASAGMADLIAKRERAKRTPCLTNLSEDPNLSSRIFHFVDEGSTSFGRGDAEPAPDVVLAGLNIAKIQCVITNEDGVRFKLRNPEGSKTYVNGKPIASGSSVELFADDRIIFGSSNVFRLFIPTKSGSGGLTERSERISWHAAMEELNEAQMAAFGEQHRAEREKAEKMRQEMEARLREMEAQIKRERQSGGERAAELEAQLQQERSRAERLQRRKEKEAEQRSLMDSKLLKTIGLVDEANSIAAELQRGMSFAIKLRVNQSQAVREATQEDFVAEKEIFIRVDYDRVGVPSSMWHYDDKFVNRLYSMREIYNDWVASGRDHSKIAAISKEDDPFYDEAIDITIGKALIYLEPLNYLMDIEERTSIYDFKGKSMGDAVVEVSLFANPECTLTLDSKHQVEELTELIGEKIVVRVMVVRVQGIPQELSRNVYVSFNFWSLGERVQSSPHKVVTINPEIGFSRAFEITVSPEFIDHIENSALELDVIGSGLYGSGEDQLRNATDTGANAGSSTDRIVYEQKISELQKELEMYKSREAALVNAVQSADADSRKNAEAILQKAGVDSSSICMLQ